MQRQSGRSAVGDAGEEHKEAGPQFSGDRAAFFEALLEAKKTWSEIVEELVLKKAPDDSEEARTQRLDAMTALVELRDTLDFKEYESIAHRLFPAEEFRVQCTSKRETRKREDGDYDTLLEYYQIRIARGPSNGKNAVIADDESYCTISIKAPGSRNYTSDIDTTVEVSDAAHLSLNARDLGRLFEGHPEKQREFQAIKGLNANSFIKIALIDQFYANCETQYHMTSATNRDSNTYSDGFLGFYPNFELSDPSNNPTTEDGPIFLEDKLSFYAEKKEESDLIEFSASFVSLRQALSDKEWAEFKKSTLESEECKDILGDFSREQQESIKARLERATKEAEDHVKYQQDNLTAVQAKIREEMAESPDRLKTEKDVCISAMNTLYVRHLYEVALVENQLQNCDSEVKDFTEKLKVSRKNKQDTRRDLDALPEGSRYRKQIEEDNAKARDEVETYEKKILDRLKKRANLLVKIQTAQVKANLFANEAYVNASAPQHVVKGMQGGGNTVLTPSQVLCSALQQGGFFLLHANHLRAEGRPEGEVAYKVAKYIQRTAHLIVGQYKEPYNDKQLTSIRGGKRVNGQIVKVLGCLDSDESFASNFTEEEYRFLNLSIELITRVKNGSLLDSQKAEAADVLSRGAFAAAAGQNLCLAILNKMVLLVSRHSLLSRYQQSLALAVATVAASTRSPSSSVYQSQMVLMPPPPSGSPRSAEASAAPGAAATEAKDNTVIDGTLDNRAKGSQAKTSAIGNKVTRGNLLNRAHAQAAPAPRP